MNGKRLLAIGLVMVTVLAFVQPGDALLWPPVIGSWGLGGLFGPYGLNGPFGPYGYCGPWGLCGAVPGPFCAPFTGCGPAPFGLGCGCPC